MICLSLIDPTPVRRNFDAIVILPEAAVLFVGGGYARERGELAG
jgi:hypothetical protein